MTIIPRDVPAPDEILEMLAENHPVYRGRSSSDALQLRATLMMQAIQFGLADRIVEHAMADLESADFPAALGSGLIDHSQKMTAAAMQMAEKNVWAHRS
jgi:hypothetical protein